MEEIQGRDRNERLNLWLQKSFEHFPFNPPTGAFVGACIPVIIFSAYPPDDPGGAVGVLRKGSADPDALLELVARACPNGPSH